jgi:hypothetical protein
MESCSRVGNIKKRFQYGSDDDAPISAVKRHRNSEPDQTPCPGAPEEEDELAGWISDKEGCTRIAERMNAEREHQEEEHRLKQKEVEKRNATGPGAPEEENELAGGFQTKKAAPG